MQISTTPLWWQRVLYSEVLEKSQNSLYVLHLFFNTDIRDYDSRFYKKCCIYDMQVISVILSLSGGFDQDFGPVPIWQSSDDGTVLGWQCRFQIRTRHRSTKHKSWCKYKLALWSLHGSLVNDHWSVKIEPYLVWIWCKCSLTYQPIQHKTVSVWEA